MSSPSDDHSEAQRPGQDGPRPQPRYGQYAPDSGAQGADSPHPPAGQASFAPGGPEHGGSPYRQPASGSSYGQPTWGQPSPAGPGGQFGPPGGQQPAPYGQAPAGAPAGQYPPAGYHHGPAEKPKRPGTLTLSMILMLVAAATSLAWGIYVMVTLQAQDASELMSDQFRESMVASMQGDPQLEELSPEEALEMTLLGLGVLALVWAFIVAAIYLTLAFVGTMTGNVGRILATIWLAASPLFLTLAYDGGSYGLTGVTVALSFAALILLWLPASNVYIRRRRDYKEAQRVGGSGPPPGSFGPGPQGQGYGPPYGGAPQQYDPSQQQPYGGAPHGPSQQYGPGPYGPGDHTSGQQGTPPSGGGRQGSGNTPYNPYA